MSETGNIPLARPLLAAGAEEHVREVLRSGQLVRGSKTAVFEAELRDALGLPYVLAVSSGTAALQLALAAVGVGPGDEVVLPDLTFPSVANAIELLGAVPVTVDVSLDTFNADADALLDAVTPRTRAVIPVDQFGLPVDIAPLMAAAIGRPWSVIEDAACALGARHDGIPCGAAATLGCYSFHPRKMVTTGEGGAVATRDPELHARVVAMSNHGMEGAGFERFHAVGWNYRLSDVHAAIGIGQAGELSERIAERRRLAGIYREALDDVDGVRLNAGHLDPEHVFQSFVVLLDEGISRDRVLDSLRRRGVEATIGSYAIHCQPHYRSRFPGQLTRPRPGAVTAFRRGVALPFFPGLADDAPGRVATALRASIDDATRAG